jgi:hypothetical protein
MRKGQRRLENAGVQDKIVRKTAVELITILIKLLMISCNQHDERDKNSDGNIGDKPDRSYIFCPGGSYEQELNCRDRKKFCASAARNHGYSTDNSHLRFLAFTHKASRHH